MKYKEFIEYMSDITQFPEEVIRTVMDAVPDVLTYMQEGEHLRTPLGTFAVKVRKEKKSLRFGKEWITIPEREYVQLKSGKRLTKGEVN
jgi:nucleoid DNA-binding protein